MLHCDYDYDDDDAVSMMKMMMCCYAMKTSPILVSELDYDKTTIIIELQ